MTVKKLKADLKAHSSTLAREGHCLRLDIWRAAFLPRDLPVLPPVLMLPACRDQGAILRRLATARAAWIPSPAAAAEPEVDSAAGIHELRMHTRS